MKKITLIIISLYFVGCSHSNKKNDAVARVYDEYLYKSDLIGLVSFGTSAKDSIKIVQSYVNSWVKQKLMNYTAENNLSSKQKNFTKQLEDYKNSLMVFEYEKELIRQKLDTSVGDTEMVAYYNKNQKEFLLKDNIVKVWYVKMPIGATNIAIVRSLYKTETANTKPKLEDFCKKNAVNYFLDDSTWLFFNDLLKEIPIKTYNQEDYLKNHRYIELEDSLYSYYVNIKDFKVKESLSPLGFESENVKNIILNKRKLKLIEDMQKKIYKNALESNDFEIFK
ncbi:MAG: hypothetical protein HGB12_08770 [Bacteroidetes bacterium]|nr:hypothetical protein [Bacteroidota bacterium]